MRGIEEGDAEVVVGVYGVEAQLLAPNAPAMQGQAIEDLGWRDRAGRSRSALGNPVGGRGW
jgi:hypothetical protein